MQNQTISPKTTTKLLFPNNVVTDTAGVTYDDGVFTIQKAGWWFISAGVGGTDYGGDVTCEIVINGTVVKVGRSWASGAATTPNMGTYVVTTTCNKMNVGDKIQIDVYSIYQLDANSRGRGNIDMCLISPTP